MSDTQEEVRIHVLGMLSCPVQTQEVDGVWLARVDGVQQWRDVVASGEDMGAAVANLRHRLDAELMRRSLR